MYQYIALLRAINVGGHNVKMAELRELFTQLGFTNVVTFIASGNVIFNSTDNNTSLLQQQIETRLLNALGYAVKTFIRTPAELTAIAEYLPFEQARLDAAAALSVGFLDRPLSKQAHHALQLLETEIDHFHCHQRELYWLCTIKQSQSKFSNTVFEKNISASATFRGINTIKRLAAKFPLS